MELPVSVEAIKAHWPKVLGLGLGWLFAVAIGLAVAAVLPERLLHVSGLLTLVIGLGLTIFWIKGRQIPRCPVGRVGFLIAISVEDESTYRVFRRDFIQNLERLLRSGQLKDHVWVGEVPQCHLSRSLHELDAVSLRERTRSTFILHGQVRTRQESGRKHYIDLSGVVGHAVTADHNSNRLRNEFSELLPRRIICEEGAELPTFELTSSLSSLVAKYIAGIAAYLSGLLDAAEVLYADSETLAKSAAKDHLVARKILERLPTRLSEIVITRARARYEAWNQRRDDSDLIAMGEILAGAPERAHDLVEWKALQAIHLVASAGADLAQVENLVLQLPEKDPVTQMNLAFFDVARGDLRAAARHYRNADSLGVTMETISEVMGFFDWFKAYRPQLACEVNYALGFISCHLLHDVSMASKAFAEFDEQRNGRFSAEAILVEKWLSHMPESNGESSTLAAQPA